MIQVDEAGLIVKSQAEIKNGYGDKLITLTIPNSINLVTGAKLKSMVLILLMVQMLLVLHLIGNLSTANIGNISFTGGIESPSYC